MNDYDVFVGVLRSCKNQPVWHKIYYHKQSKSWPASSNANICAFYTFQLDQLGISFCVLNTLNFSRISLWRQFISDFRVEYLFLELLSAVWHRTSNKSKRWTAKKRYDLSLIQYIQFVCKFSAWHHLYADLMTTRCHSTFLNQYIV